MLLLETFETVGGIWLGLSAVAFIFAAAFFKTRQKSAAIDVTARRDELMLDLVAKTEKARVSKAPARKAA